MVFIFIVLEFFDVGINVILIFFCCLSLRSGSWIELCLRFDVMICGIWLGLGCFCLWLNVRKLFKVEWMIMLLVLVLLDVKMMLLDNVLIMLVIEVWVCLIIWVVFFFVLYVLFGFFYLFFKVLWIVVSIDVFKGVVVL